MQSMNSFADFSNYISSLIRQHDYKRANLLLDQNLNSHPNNPMLWHLKSIVSFSQSNFADAEQQAKKAISLKPNLTAAISNLAKLKKQQGLLNDAINLFENAISYEPHNSQYIHELAITHHLAGNYTKSLELSNKLLTQFPNNINVLLSASQSMLKLEMYEDVINVTNKILQQDGNNISAINNQAIALKTLCKWQEAVTLLDKGLSITDIHPALLKNKASCLVLLGRHKEASEIYEELLKQQPDDLDSHHWLNLIYWELADDRFLNSYNFAINIQPNNSDLYIEKSKKHILAKQFIEADEALDTALKINPFSSSALTQLGVLKRENNSFEDSLRLLTKANSISPENIEIKEELAKSLLANGESKSAMNHIDQLLSINEFQQGWLALKTTALKQMNSDEYFYYVNYERDILNCKIDVPDGFKNLNEFNRELETVLKEYHYAKQHPLNQSLIGGSQTAEKLFDYHLPIIQQLRSALREQTLAHLANLPQDNNHPMLKRNTGNFIETDSWSVLLQSKGFHNNHHHPAGWYSGPYYIHIPNVVHSESEMQGWIKFGQPGFTMAEQMTPDIFEKPEEGKLVQFPSYYWHGTLPFHDETFRMCVAYDVIPK